jgi:hypothetical protein
MMSLIDISESLRGVAGIHHRHVIPPQPLPQSGSVLAKHGKAIALLELRGPGHPKTKNSRSWCGHDQRRNRGSTRPRSILLGNRAAYNSTLLYAPYWTRLDVAGYAGE